MSKFISGIAIALLAVVLAVVGWQYYQTNGGMPEVIPLPQLPLPQPATAVPQPLPDVVVVTATPEPAAEPCYAENGCSFVNGQRVDNSQPQAGLPNPADIEGECAPGWQFVAYVEEDGRIAQACLPTVASIEDAGGAVPSMPSAPTVEPRQLEAEYIDLACPEGSIGVKTVMYDGFLWRRCVLHADAVEETGQPLPKETGAPGSSGAPAQSPNDKGHAGTVRLVDDPPLSDQNFAQRLWDRLFRDGQ